MAGDAGMGLVLGSGDDPCWPLAAPRTAGKRMGEIGRGRRGSRPLADWVENCIAPALARYGFGESDIVTAWPDIAGARVAAFAEPVQIKWPRRAAAADGGATRPPATLVVRVEGAFALELQDLAPLLIERINAHLGWRCIGKLALRQAPLLGRPAPKEPPARPSPRSMARARDLAAGVTDDGLREALERLGARVLKPR